MCALYLTLPVQNDSRTRAAAGLRYQPTVNEEMSIRNKARNLLHPPSQPNPLEERVAVSWGGVGSIKDSIASKFPRVLWTGWRW